MVYAKRSEEVPMYGPILMAKALQFHTKLNLDGGEELKEALGGSSIFHIDTGSISVQHKVSH